MSDEPKRKLCLGFINNFSPEYLHECLEYRDGELFWKVRSPEHFSSLQVWRCSNTRYAGKRAGTTHPEGYVVINFTIDGRKYILRRSHVVWRMFGNSLPEDHLIDHIDGNTSNDCIENLRSCTNRQNCYNRRRFKSNKSGYRGVHLAENNKWRVYISVEGKTLHLGRYHDFEEAVRVRKEAEEKYFGEFLRKDDDPVVEWGGLKKEIEPYEPTPEEEIWLNSIGSL